MHSQMAAQERPLLCIRNPEQGIDTWVYEYVDAPEGGITSRAGHIEDMGNYKQPATHKEGCSPSAYNLGSQQLAAEMSASAALEQLPLRSIESRGTHPAHRMGTSEVQSPPAIHAEVATRGLSMCTNMPTYSVDTNSAKSVEKMQPARNEAPIICTSMAGQKRIAFGRWCGQTFAEIVRRDRSYCQWALGQQRPSGMLREFADYLRALQPPAGRGDAGPLQTTNGGSTPPQRQLMGAQSPPLSRSGTHDHLREVPGVSCRGPQHPGTWLGVSPVSCRQSHDHLQSPPNIRASPASSAAALKSNVSQVSNCAPQMQASNGAPRMQSVQSFTHWNPAATGVVAPSAWSTSEHPEHRSASPVGGSQTCVQWSSQDCSPHQFRYFGERPAPFSRMPSAIAPFAMSNLQPSWQTNSTSCVQTMSSQAPPEHLEKLADSSENTHQRNAASVPNSPRGGTPPPTPPPPKRNLPPTQVAFQDGKKLEGRWTDIRSYTVSTPRRAPATPQTASGKRAPSTPQDKDIRGFAQKKAKCAEERGCAA